MHFSAIDSDISSTKIVRATKRITAREAFHRGCHL